MAQKFEIVFDASMDVNKVRNAVGEIQKSLSTLSLPQNLTNKFTSTINDLSRELDNFERLSSKGFEVKADFNKFEKSGQKILDLFSELKYDVKSLGASDKDLEKLFPKSLTDNIKSANDALNNFDKATKNNASSIGKTNKKLEEQQKILSNLKKQQTEIDNKVVTNKDTAALRKNNYEAAKKELTNYKHDNKEYNDYLNAIKKRDDYARENPENVSWIGRYNKEVERLGQHYNELVEKLKNAKALLDETFTEEDKTKKLETINSKIEQTEAAISDLKNQLNGIKVSDNQALEDLFAALEKIPGIDLSKFEHNLDGAKAAINSLTREGFQQVQGDIQNFINSVNSADEPVEELTEDIRKNTEAHQRFDDRIREVDAIKERITAFFGLGNAINLARNAIRNAFESIKELDATMTEIAVVTDFSVGDMWEQLPEYTKRANELGIATNEAYKASALFYQQGK